MSRRKIERKHKQRALNVSTQKSQTQTKHWPRVQILSPDSSIMTSKASGDRRFGARRMTYDDYTSLIKCFSRFLGMEAVLLYAHKIDKAVRKQLSNGIRDFIARIPVDRTNADHVSMIVILDVIGENGSIG